MDSQKLLRNLLGCALRADLEKNELRVFLALLHQTVGFGKAADPLTSGRLAQLTGIRKDRIGKATSGLVEKGLFEREGHPWLEFTYSIPARFFESEVVSRFFAPSAPLGGKASPSVVEENHSAGTYRDTPLQSFNPDSTNSDTGSGEQRQTSGGSGVCDVDNKSGAKPLLPEKPGAVNPQIYRQLLPALKTLSYRQASDVLQLLELAIQEGSIRTTPERMGGGLIKAARQGTLDTSRLEQAQAASAQRQQAAQAEAARQQREQAQERLHLEQLARLADVPLSTLLGGAE